MPDAQDRQPLQMAPYVRCKMLDGGVSLPGVLGERFSGDILQVPRQAALQPVRPYRAQRQRILFADHLRQLRQRSGGDAVRALPRKQFKEDHAQRIDVAGNRVWLAPYLLRAGVRRRHHGNPGDRDILGRTLPVQGARQSKIEQFGAPPAVTRMLPGFRSRCTIRRWWAHTTASHTARNRRSRSATSKALALAILDQRQAVYVLHDEVRLALFGRASIQ